MLLNYKILQKDFNKRYINAFQEYAIRVMYGNQLIMGSELVNEE